MPDDAHAPIPVTTAEPPKPGKSIADLITVWQFARHYPQQLVAAALALIISAAATGGVPYAFKLIIDKGFSGGGNINRWFEILLLLVAVMALATATRFYFISWVGERVVADLRRAVHRNLLRMAPGFFEENRPAEITSRLTVDTTIIEQVVGSTLSISLRNTVMVVVCTTVLFILSPKLASMMLLGIPVVVLPIILLGRREIGRAHV